MAEAKEEVHKILHSRRTFGQKAADMLTKYAGSWGFIILLIVLLFAWVLVNSYFLIAYSFGKPFDPYPFILLNLVLACLTAIQTPVILMSQNRQGEKIRRKAEYDYEVNVKAEKEIEEIQEQLRRIERKLGK